MHACVSLALFREELHLVLLATSSVFMSHKYDSPPRIWRGDLLIMLESHLLYHRHTAAEVTGKQWIDGLRADDSQNCWVETWGAGYYRKKQWWTLGQDRFEPSLGSIGCPACLENSSVQMLNHPANLAVQENISFGKEHIFNIGDSHLTYQDVGKWTHLIRRLFG